MKGGYRNNFTEIKMITKEYYEKLYAKELDNPDGMDKFLEKYNVSKPTQEEIGNLIRNL